MTNEPMRTNDSAPPSTAPMPEHPISDPSSNAMPAPSTMPDAAGGSGGGVEEHSDEAPPVIEMADYPDGRGGMRMVPMESSEPPSPAAARPADEPIGARPSATEMPARS